MPAGYSLLVTEADGNIISAANRNAEHQNHITNGIPSMLDDHSSSVSQMQTQTDPGEAGSESQPTSLAGELERIRYAIKEIKGTTYWYETVAGGLGRYPMGSAINLGLTLSGGVLTVTGQDGTALSTSNMGLVVVPGATAGYTVGLKVTAPAVLKDDVNASSDLTNLGFGITEAAAWANAAPFWLYVVNKANSNLGGVDGNSCFALARNPAMFTTPAAANNIGNTSAIPATDDQTSILLLGDSFTVANYVSLPAQLIGGVSMTWSSANTDWTIGSLATFGGIGCNTLDKMFANPWSMPQGQNGASASTHIQPNGGTAPLFSTNNYSYTINRQGMVRTFAILDGDGGTDGSGAVHSKLALPYAAPGSEDAQLCGAVKGATTITSIVGCYVNVSIGTTQGNLWYQAVAGALPVITLVTNAMFSSGARSVNVNFTYKAY